MLARCCECLHKHVRETEWQDRSLSDWRQRSLYALVRSTSDKSSVVKELGRGAYSTETTEPTLGPVTMAQLCISDYKITDD